MSWNILPKNVLQYFLTKLKGLMYTKTEVDNLIPSITPNPSTTTDVLSGLEIDGVGYNIQSGDVSGKYDKITQSGVGSCLSDGQHEYFKIATLTITDTNTNGPIGFEVSQTFNQVTLLQIGFAKTDDTDPDIAWFYTNQRNNYWIVKENTSVWGLYGQFENAVDGCSLHRIVGYRVNNGVTVTVNLTNVSALPSGATQPTYGGSVNYANIANRAASATDSTKVAKAGDTMTGRLNFTFDTAEINFRQNHASYDGVISYQTAGNEAWLFTTKNAVTSIMFVNGEDTITNIASNRWQSLTPGLQIKNNKVAIGKLIANGTTPTHALDVSGTTNIEAGSDTPLRIKRNSDTGACYMGFYNNSGALGYFAVLADKRPYFEPGGGSDTRIALWGDNISKFNNDSKYITGITKAMVTTALGYTPPTSDTNDKVTVQHSTSNAQYPVMFEGHNNQTTYTTGVFKTAYVTVNPYNACMYVKHTSNGHFTRIISDGIYFRNDTEGSRIYDGGSQALWFMASGENDYKVFFGVADSMWTLCPGKNGYIKLGSPNFKWAQIYSTSGSINTSDRKEKKDIVPLDDSAVDFIMALNPVSYKMINGESGRTHYGMIAQDVEEELAELGMTAMDFAGFCKDEKRVRIESVEEGRVVTKEQKKPGEYVYGLRYEEFIAPIIKTEQLQQEDINSLKEEISLLKEEIALLKQRLQILEDK